MGDFRSSVLVALTFEVTAHEGDAGYRTLYTKFEVHRPSGSKDMPDFRSQR